MTDLYKINPDYHDRTKYRFINNAIDEGLMVKVEPYEHGNYARHTIEGSIEAAVHLGLGADALARCEGAGLGDSDECGCQACAPDLNRMFVCSECGNKRCPKATNHILYCTRSNDPGQKGSSWEDYKTPTGDNDD